MTKPSETLSEELSGLSNDLIFFIMNLIEFDLLMNEISKIENRRPFLDLLLEARVDGKQMSQKEIRDEVTTFMFRVVLVNWLMDH